MKPLLYAVLPRPPHPSRDGLAIRNYHLLAALAGAFRVRAVTLLDPERSYGGGEFPPDVAAEFVPQRPRNRRRRAAAAASLLGARAYSELLYRSAALERLLERWVRDERPAWIVAHAYHVAPAALRAGAPAWIDLHNLDSEIWQRTAETAGSPPARWFARIQAPRVLRLERDLARRAAGLSCVSKRDASALATLGAAVAPLVVENGVDLSRYAMRTSEPAADVVFFVGDLSWPPNAEGVRWFHDRVWGRIRSRRPGARAEILGRGAGKDLGALAAPDFAFLGEGGDTRPHWSGAAVAVVPLRSGGGTRLKILEAAACGAPVVATPVGAEGLEFEPETEIRVREDPEAFADAVVALLADREAARRQALRARVRVEARYGWEPIGRDFAGELLRRAGERR
jgi:glycosyltransferase involved in cell wall biosynthesis